MPPNPPTASEATWDGFARTNKQYTLTRTVRTYNPRLGPFLASSRRNRPALCARMQRRILRVCVRACVLRGFVGRSTPCRGVGRVCTFQVEALAAIGAAAAVPSKQSEARKRLLKLMQVEDSVVRCAEYSSCGHSPPLPLWPLTRLRLLCVQRCARRQRYRVGGARRQGKGAPAVRCG